MAKTLEDELAQAKLLVTPGMSQAAIIGLVGKIDSLEGLAVIVEELLQQAKEGNEDNLELVLVSQVSMLNALGTAFLQRSFKGYDNPEVQEVFPNLPKELADLSLRSWAEMRKCIELLHFIRTGKKLRTPAKATTKTRMVIKDESLVRGSQTETSTSDTAMATLEEKHGSHVQRREANCQVQPVC